MSADCYAHSQKIVGQSHTPILFLLSTQFPLCIHNRGDIFSVAGVCSKRQRSRVISHFAIIRRFKRIVNMPVCVHAFDETEPASPVAVVSRCAHNFG